MRKITIALAMDVETFLPRMLLKVKNPDDTDELLTLDSAGQLKYLEADKRSFSDNTISSDNSEESKYTKIQLKRIAFANEVLSTKNYPEMTDGEIEFLSKNGSGI